LGECQNRQTYVKVEFNIAVKYLAEPSHATKISVNC
jgi:hypothetical protein